MDWNRAERATPGRGYTLTIYGSRFSNHRFTAKERYEDCLFAELAEFSRSIFESEVSFNRVTFSQGANFTGAIFKRGASFIDCRFEAPGKAPEAPCATFSNCQFWYQAWFWKSSFEGKADFSQTNIRKGQPPHERIPDNGRANFSWCRFEGDAELSQLWIEGPAYFWGTRFLREANLYALRFESSADFEGTRWKVCVSVWEIPMLFHRLLKIGILHPDAEMNGYANFIGVKNEAELTRKLKDLPSAHDIQKIILPMWNRLALPMFSDQEVDFSGVSAANASSVRFIGVNLGKAKLADSSLALAQFDDVVWARQKMFAARRKRSAIYDESASTDITNVKRVGRFYHDIRVSYQGKKQPDLAGDFYYGEMEMRRLSQSRFIRRISLTAWFKYLNGYGENYAFSLILLAVIVLVLFPALYMAAGLERRNPLLALLHSLEVVTFLKEGSQPASTGIAVRFIEGFERVLGALQLGLSLAAIKRKFERG